MTESVATAKKSPSNKRRLESDSNPKLDAKRRNLKSDTQTKPSDTKFRRPNIPKKDRRFRTYAATPRSRVARLTIFDLPNELLHQIWELSLNPSLPKSHPILGCRLSSQNCLLNFGKAGFQPAPELPSRTPERREIPYGEIRYEMTPDMIDSMNCRFFTLDYLCRVLPENPAIRRSLDALATLVDHPDQLDQLGKLSRRDMEYGGDAWSLYYYMPSKLYKAPMTSENLTFILLLKFIDIWPEHRDYMSLTDRRNREQEAVETYKFAIRSGDLAAMTVIWYKCGEDLANQGLVRYCLLNTISSKSMMCFVLMTAWHRHKDFDALDPDLWRVATALKHQDEHEWGNWLNAVLTRFSEKKPSMLRARVVWPPLSRDLSDELSLDMPKGTIIDLTAARRILTEEQLEHASSWRVRPS